MALPHNPTPGPAGGPFVYGHVWVVLGLLARHPAWGVVALPLRARLYVRQKNLSGIVPKHRPLFRTKLELAVELVGWAVSWLGHLGKPVWVVVDGAYAKAPFFRPMRALKVTTVSRLRKDSALWTVPGPRAPHRRGPNRTYGEQRIALAKRAGQTRGWTIGAFHLCLWTFTMTEAWAWNRDEKALIEHRSASPWDNGARRPSHADKRRARRRELMGNEIRAVLRPGATEQELQAAAERMLQLAA